MPTGPRFADLGRWLEWQQMLHPGAIDLGLARVGRVLARTGWQRPRCPVITVGGTNGKGSCVALLAAMLKAAGCRVGTFTSPHLVEYSERIRIDGTPVSEASLVAAFERTADGLAPDSLTYFEFNTLAALLVFETAGLDAIVLEVGMGGRLDAVNLVDADVAVIVSVGLDHMEWLGPDVESIGREKAGIMRRGRPAIVGMARPPQSVLQSAAEVGADLRLRSRDFDGEERDDGTWTYRDRDGQLDALPAPALPGAVQVGNAAVALAALRALDGRMHLERSAIEAGLRDVRLPGRFQRIEDRRGFEWVLDVAHNPDSARTLAGNLARYPVAGRTIAVCGMLSDKDVESVVTTLRAHVQTWIAADTAGPRGLSAAALAERAAAGGSSMVPGGGVADAMRRAASEASPGDRIVVFGSFHTVGPALVHLRETLPPGEAARLWL
ncbi:MAG TPA: bifunctional tetrahydrofolate synthase/dihydrofolate synthase [Steroidobacteraceae bacterium]|nr:bifunctional tetrahydrofolate synthase/dihydrofolate synthase [Steroidobacteraceae bacterium]